MGDFWRSYASQDFFDELIDEHNQPRAAAAPLAAHLDRLGNKEIAARRLAADLSIKAMGISFTVYSEAGMIDRAWPFDIIPRVISEQAWSAVRTGLVQRLTALNLFMQDLYGEQHILRDGVVPRDVLAQSSSFRPECVGMRPAGGIWANICGSDLVRDGTGQFFVLEDNLRVPSGVSYMIENRLVSKRIFPEMFAQSSILPVDDYPSELLDALGQLSPRKEVVPNVVLLTPGVFNSAYFEHVWLASQMGAELVQGSDLVVDKDCVYVRTIFGPQRVDVIYRRVDDAFLDPKVFRKDSTLGVPGLMQAWLKGNVAIANAPGAGVADDKVIYAYVPQIIKYYLDEDAQIPNVPTFLCVEEKQRAHVLANLDKLVVKPANESGGYGMLIGPHASEEERLRFRDLIKQNPRNYIAQPTLALSTAPTLVDGMPVARHVDLRPFVISRPDGGGYVTTGGLTRVALSAGSLVVNSSQGGGSKDTWIVQ